jgi:hypothetical protein
MRVAQRGRWAFVLLGTAVQPSRLGTIAIEIAAAQSSKDLSRSRNTQAKSLLEILFLAIAPPSVQGIIAPNGALTFLVRVYPSRMFSSLPASESDMLGGNRQSGASMFFVAGVLTVLAGSFYAAGHHELGSAGVVMCRYGSTFCDHPMYLLVAAGLAAVWGAFVSVR